MGKILAYHGQLYSTLILQEILWCKKGIFWSHTLITLSNKNMSKKYFMIYDLEIWHEWFFFDKFILGGQTSCYKAYFIFILAFLSIPLWLFIYESPWDQAIFECSTNRYEVQFNHSNLIIQHQNHPLPRYEWQKCWAFFYVK